MPTTAHRLRTARIRAGLSQRDLHYITGISLRTIIHYEDPCYGRRRNPAFVRAWADACDTDFERLWQGPPTVLSA